VVDSLGSSHRGRGAKDTGASSRHPEYSRSMSSDNWREAKKRDSETDVAVSWRSRQDHSRTGTYLFDVLSNTGFGPVMYSHSFIDINYLRTFLGIGPFHFQVGSRKRRPNLAF